MIIEHLEAQFAQFYQEQGATMVRELQAERAQAQQSAEQNRLQVQQLNAQRAQDNRANAEALQKEGCRSASTKTIH